MNFEKPAFYNQPDSGEQTNNSHEDATYSPEDLQHLDQASDAAAEIIRWSLTSESANRKTVNTSEGVRGYISNTFAGGSVEGLFKGAKLSQVGIKLDSGGETKQLSIQGLEEGEESMVFIDGQLVDAREIPVVQRVVEAIRQEMAAAQEVVIKSLEQAEGDQEVSLVESESELESESGQVDSLEADQAATAEVLSADSDQLKYQNLSEQEREALKRLQ